MEEYIGKICPYCKTEIKEGEALKVCPQCNIPHHEGCWEENKGCTTFGCSEQYYEEQGTNPTDACSNCGTMLGDGQDFCPRCGTPKGGIKKNVCSKCGAELQAGQMFCPACGQKVDLIVDDTVNSAISQFNAGISKKNNKTKKLPAIIAAVLAACVALGLIISGNVKEKKAKAEKEALEAAVETYIETANKFFTAVRSSGSTMEDIGNEIQTAWKAYVNSTRYNGSRYYSVDSAVNAAQSSKKASISTVKSSNSTITSYYKKLLELPDVSNQQLQEIKYAVKRVYDAYNEMYDCVISPSGNYTSWTSEFGDTDSALAKALKELRNVL